MPKLTKKAICLGRTDHDYRKASLLKIKHNEKCLKNNLPSTSFVEKFKFKGLLSNKLC